jgi:hypothetical protein
MKGNSMSKPIRPSIVVRRPATLGGKRPIWVIASGGEVFILKRSTGAATWVAANEADFGLKPGIAANEPSYDNEINH